VAIAVVAIAVVAIAVVEDEYSRMNPCLPYLDEMGEIGRSACQRVLDDAY
jgi:hypothetical protein